MQSVRRLFFLFALLGQVCALLNVKPVRLENSDRHRPFAVLLKILGRGIFAPQRRGTGWLLADRDGLFVVTAAHTFGNSVTEGDRVHVFAAVPDPYRGAHQLYRLRRTIEGERPHESLRSNALPSADHYENVAFISFMNEADGDDQSNVPNDIAVIRLTGDNRQLLAGTRPLELHQLPTNISVLEKDTRLRLFGGASPQTSHDINYYVVDPEDCVLNSNEPKGFCFKSKSDSDQPIKGDSGAAIICPDNITEYGDPQVCGMLFGRTNTMAGVALSIAHYGRFIRKMIERVP